MTGNMEQTKVRLRAMEPEDLVLLYEVENDPKMWSVGDSCTPYSKYVLKQYIAQNTNDVFTDGQLRLMIEEKETSKTVGIIDLIQFSCRHSRAEVGILIFQDERGKGYAQEALGLLCNYAIRFLSMHQLYAYISINNAASINLFQKIDFQQVGKLKDWLRSNDTYEDVIVLQKILQKNL